MPIQLPVVVFFPILWSLALPFFTAQDTEGVKRLHQYAGLGAILLFILVSLVWNWPGFSFPNFVLPWVPSLGIHFALGSDGLSTTLVVLTSFLYLMALQASPDNITHRVKLYYGLVAVLITAVLGVFLARDLFTFFLFWELELIPMYFLIAIWGGPRRDYASVKFVLYTLFGSAFLAAAMLGLYFYVKSHGGAPESIMMFSVIQKALASHVMPVAMQTLLFLGFFIMFAIKLPVVPFHTWLPDAHGEAPTPISMLLAGILLKMGAYGMLRLCFGWFPQAAHALAPYLGALAVINIVYTAGIALVQKDMKRLVAYSSVSHMGFVLLGLVALNAAGFNGAVFVMVSHGVVSAAMFMCVGTLYRRTHTREIAQYGGFALQTPGIFYFSLFMSMASLGLPLLIGFAGESLVFYGAFISKAFVAIRPLTITAGLGVVLCAAYLLWLLKRVFYGPAQERWSNLPDLNFAETLVLGSLALAVLGYGMCPRELTQHFEGDMVSLVARQYPAQLELQVQTPCARKEALSSMTLLPTVSAKTSVLPALH